MEHHAPPPIPVTSTLGPLTSRDAVPSLLWLSPLSGSILAESVVPICLADGLRDDLEV